MPSRWQQASVSSMRSCCFPPPSSISSSHWPANAAVLLDLWPDPVLLPQDGAPAFFFLGVCVGDAFSTAAMGDCETRRENVPETDGCYLKCGRQGDTGDNSRRWHQGHFVQQHACRVNRAGWADGRRSMSQCKRPPSTPIPSPPSWTFKWEQRRMIRPPSSSPNQDAISLPCAQIQHLGHVLDRRDPQSGSLKAEIHAGE